MGELEAHMVDACRTGEPAAFRALVECYQDRVFALCVALAGRNDAEDLAQETFLRVHRSIVRFVAAGAAPLSGWVLTIARRLCVDRARGARWRVEVPFDGALAAGVDAALEQTLDRARQAVRLARAIGELPEEQRAVLALREWDGL